MTLRFSSHSCSASTLQTLKKCSRTLKQMNKMICRKIFETFKKNNGLYNNKAKNIIKTSKILVDQYKGKVPNNREALESLPGIGRKSANVILNSAFGHATIGVDTHVFRVSNRTKLATGKNVFDVEQKLNAIIPDIFKQHAHHWLVLHGRYIC